jgi:hypothetical protein
MDLHYLINPTMEPMEREFFLPSVPDGFHVVRHDTLVRTSGEFMQDGFLDLMRLRTGLICREIEAKMDGNLIVWSDVDVVFLSDQAVGEIKRAMTGLDLLFQKEHSGIENDTCNWGFQVIRRNQPNLEFYRAVLELQTEDPSRDDQATGNELLASFRTPKWGHLPLSFSAESNGGVTVESVLYHANCTVNNSQETKRRRLTHARDFLRDHGNHAGERASTKRAPSPCGRDLQELLLTLKEFLERDDGDEFMWVIEDRVWGEGPLLDELIAGLEPCTADLLATDARVRFEDLTWNWWKCLEVPEGITLARGENLVAAFLPLARYSRRGAQVVVEGVESGWRGHPEVLVPTLVRQAGLRIEDIGGARSFTPPERIGLWYDRRTWHWQGPVERVPGLLHFPVPRQTRALASGRLERLQVERSDERSGGLPVSDRSTECRRQSADGISRLPKILYVSPVGGAAVELLPGVMETFRGAGADCWMLNYDDAEFAVPVGVRVIRDKGYKWQLALQHLQPEAVAEYDYVFFWDDDLRVSGFDPLRFVRIMQANRLEMAQPAIHSPHGLSHAITRHRPCPPPWRDPDGVTVLPVVGRLTNFVEIMAPVFSRQAWREFYSYLDPANQSGWGYDYIPLGRKGIVDAMPVEHTRAVQSINGGSESEIGRFLDNQGLFRHAPVEQGWLFEVI